MATTTTKKDLVDRISELTGHKRPVVREVVQMFLDQITEELRDGRRLEFRDFGIFEVKTRRARRAQNPKTLERVDVPPKRTVKFKVGRLLREGLDHLSPPLSTPVIEPKPRRARTAARAV
ncbi:MAG: integration host factor subunit beta [Phycisphaeraceae bacterium]|nr:integration host factor subunit beta [Phycisphaerae bacterium]MBX3393121.1 integration host factor subunit beta [Phycisphaeraceae bacterium]HRJ50052.1 HU family DNA-binding protein [Phycisphaerales bacterium]